MTVGALAGARDDPSPEAALSVSFRKLGWVCVLAIEGELRAGSIAGLEAQMDRLGRTAFHEVVFDVTHVSLLDDVGARVLTGLCHYVHARGGRVRLIGARPWLADALSATPLAACVRTEGGARR